jgi:uncharacterized protein YgiM (DUF1202 family)
MSRLLPFGILLVAACAGAKAAPAPVPVPDTTATRPVTRVVRETVTVRDPEIERRLARLELRVIEKEAQTDELQTRLDDARDEVVRTMAKLDANRAEAASAVAEADVAAQSLRATAGAAKLPETAQVNKLQQQASAEFNKKNYGGALYLANQAKAAATTGKARAASVATGTRQGETPFALPIRLKVASRGNVREGPGTTFGVVFAVEPGLGLTGVSYTDDWVRVTDDGGRTGWIFKSLVGRP